MNTEIIEVDGYRVHVSQDLYAENPFTAWYGEPPLLTLYAGMHGHLTAYNDAPEKVREVLHLLPADTWEKPKRAEFIRKFVRPHVSMRELAAEIENQGCLFDAVDSILSDCLGNKPEGWRSGIEWMEAMQGILSWAGIPALYEHSKGHCQGDCTLCLVVLTDSWFETTGAKKENAESIMTSAIKLFSAWAWGDVYQIDKIEAPAVLDEDGDPQEWLELEEVSCGGFYGSNHEESGLLESARDTIAFHKEKEQQEAETLESALFCNA